MTKKQHKPGSIMQDDPLAWLTEAPGENLFEQALPTASDSNPASTPHSATPPVVTDTAQDANPADDNADEGTAWGLFDDVEVAAPEGDVKAVSIGDGDESWGLFEADTSDDGEGISAPPSALSAEEGWGLFEGEAAVAPDGAVLSLGSALLMQDVDAARGEWLIYAAGDAFDIDAAEVERVDAAGMQLLCALALSERQHGRALSWRNVSPPLRGAAASLGVSKLLGLAA